MFTFFYLPAKAMLILPIAKDEDTLVGLTFSEILKRNLKKFCYIIYLAIHNCFGNTVYSFPK